MPLYEYICANCGRRFDLLASIENRDSVERKCPECTCPVSSRVTVPSKLTVYFHGRGWSCVDKNYGSNDAPSD